MQKLPGEDTIDKFLDVLQWLRLISHHTNEDIMWVSLQELIYRHKRTEP
jgi:hypothetical protein